MPITEQDIKLLASQRMTDTPDGGGRMTGNVVQSGVDNNIFDDVSNLDRVYGNVSMRKVFAAVLTNDTEKYMGARVVIDQPPEDPNVQCVMFAASEQFDNRTGASVKVESYLAQGVGYLGLLFGDHLVGQSAISVAVDPKLTGPGSGDVLVLSGGVGGSSDVQFVRVTNSSSQVATFYSADGDSFELRLCTCAISDPLRHAFAGWGAVKGGIATSDMRAGTNANRALLYDVVVADASQYYGIRPLAEAATAGSFGVRCDTVFSNLLPSAQIEAPIADARTNGLADGLAAAGTPITQTLSLDWSPTQSMFVGGAILPGTLAVARDGVNITDSNGVLRASGADVGSLDYENGILTVSTASLFAGPGLHTVTYTPAAAFTSATKSVGIPITLANRSTSFVVTLNPLPARGSLSASYLSGGRWYVLRDGGTGALTGADASLGIGNLNMTTGTLILTLGAQPDVGGAIVLQWSEAAQVLDNTNTTLRFGGKAWTVLNTAGSTGDDAAGLPIEPGTVALTWPESGATRTATDDGLGALTGDATGIVDYQRGHIYFAPNTLPDKDGVLVLNQSKYTASGANITWTPGSGVGLFSASAALPPNISPGSLRVKVFAYCYATSGFVTPALDPHEILQGPRYSDAGASFSLVDNGTGGLTVNGQVVGTIIYDTGSVSVDIPESLFPSLTAYAHTDGPFSFGYGYIRGFQQTVRPTLANWENAGAPSAYFLVSGSAPDVKSIPLSALVLQVSSMAPGYVLSGARFDLGGLAYRAQPSGTLVHSINPATGSGIPSGIAVSAQGLIAINDWQSGGTNLAANWRGVQAPPSDGADSLSRDTSILFRTPTVNLRPGSVQLTGTMADGTSFLATSSSNGIINGTRVKGRVNHEAGLVELLFVNPVATTLGGLDASYLGIPGVGTVNLDAVLPTSLRYNAVAYRYLPLDVSILGLDPVRLPQDGRVPVFKAGRVVLVHNTQSLAPQAVADGQTVNTGRTLLSRIRVWGNDGLPITTGWSADLDAGTVTFSTVTGYSQPVTVEHRVDDEALCVESQITGDLRLSRSLTHDYPLGSYVSSSYVMGTLQAAAQDSFGQEAWTGEWADTAIGTPLLASYNDVDSPIAVTNAGAITERWACIFTSNTTFNLVGSQVGQIITGSTAAVLSPVNPATGVPYFTLQPSGWGSGWAAGNVLRFNTAGAARPLWLARTVLQSPAAPPGTDQITISIMGDIDQ